MPRIISALLLGLILAFPGLAQTRKKPRKAKPAAAKPTVKDNRVVTARPVVEGDPDTPPDRIKLPDLKAKLAAGAHILLLDTRSTEVWNASPTRIKGAIHAPLDQVEQQMSAWKKTQEIIAYCA